MLSSLLSAAYFGPIVYKAYFEAGSDADANIREVPWMVAPLVISAAASLLLGLFPDPVLKLAAQSCGYRVSDWECDCRELFGAAT